MTDFMEGWNLAEIQDEKRRMAILRNLWDLDRTDHESSADMLAHACRALGVPSSTPEVAAAIGWLEAHGLVTMETIGPNGDDGVLLAKITKSGKAVARGHQTVTGVMRLRDFN